MMEEASAALASTSPWLSLCGKMAPLSSICLYLAPIPTVLNFFKRGTVGDLPLVPYTSMISNSLIWIVYGRMNQLTGLWAANVFGFVLSSYYFLSFALFAPPGASSTIPGSVAQHVKGFCAIAAYVAYFAQKKKSIPIGQLGVGINLAMYASPLAAVKAVLASKSAESIPLPLTVAALLSCIFWSISGIYDMKDAYVWAPAVAGIAFGSLQVALKIAYRENKKEQKRLGLSNLLNSVKVTI